LSLSVAVSEAVVAEGPALGVDAFGRDDLGEPVGGDPDLPLAVVDEPVVAAAEQGPVVQVGLPADRPGGDVVGPGGRPVAAGEHAAAVAVRQGDPLALSLSSFLCKGPVGDHR
jgi:hypothetical protein